jgi:malonyl CoA-acyl carrier protein transacylase
MKAADQTSLNAQRRALRREEIYLAPIQTPAAYGVLFPGHGSQYLDQLADLRGSDRCVAATFDEADEAYHARYGRPLSACIYTDLGATPATLAEPTAMQCAIFTASVAQYRRLTRFAEPPTIVIGHSLGEYAAYVAGGVLSFADGLAGVMARAETVIDVPADQRGTMLAVRVRTDAERRTYRRLLLLATTAGDLGEAIANSTSQRVVSGSQAAIAAFAEAASHAHLPVTRLRVTHAYHSPLLRSCVAPLRARLSQLTFRAPALTIVSSITAEVLEGSDSADLPALLAAQLVQPFDFGALISRAATLGVSDFVEAGPSAVLTGIVEAEKGDVSCVPLDSRRRSSLDDERQVRLYLTSLGIHEPAPQAVTASAAATHQSVTALVSGVTGYPRYALAGGMALNRIGLVAELRDRLSSRLEDEYGPGCGDLSWSIDRLAAHLLESDGVPSSPDKGGAAEVSSIADTEPTRPDEGDSPDWVAEFVAAFAAATGYPSDVIEPDLDLEADLGVDSVKRAQVIATLTDRHHIPEDTLDLTGATTITDLATRLTHLTAPSRPAPDAVAAPTIETTPAVEEEPLTPAPPGQAEAALRYLPRALVRDLAQSPRAARDLAGLRLILVPADDEEVTSGTRRLLEAAGADVWVSAATESTRNGDVDQEKLASALADEHHRLGPRDGVVLLSGYSTPRDVLALDATAFSIAWRQQYAQVFSVCQEYYQDLAEAGGRAVIAVLTQCGGGFGLKATSPGDALGCIGVGFVKSVAKELPDLRLCLVDVDDVPPVVAAGLMVDELVAGSLDDEVSYLGDQRHVIKVVPVPVPPVPDHRETAPGAIVFSGGSRGIALECALALAASHLVLTSAPPSPLVILGRSRLDDPESLPYLAMTDDAFAHAQPEILDLLHRTYPENRPRDLQERFRKIANNRQLWRTTQRVAQGTAPIEYVTCDVGDAEAVAQVMADIRARHGGVRGLVHAAGLESLGLLPRKNYTLAEQVVHTKLQGFHHLVSTVDPDTLDFLVAFTSISGRFGMDGQTEYTAGAAAVSALCSQLARRHRSTTVVALDWTAWSEVGMATHHSVQEVQEMQRGLRYLPPDEGARHFLRELSGGGYDPQVMIFGPLGTNEPRAALDCLTPDRRGVAAPVSHGSVVDPGTFPMVETQLRNDHAEGLFTRRLDPRLDTMLIDHLVQGSPTLPGVFHLEAMAEAAQLATSRTDLMIESAEFETFVKCPEGRVCDLSITVSSQDPDRIEATIRADVVSPGGVVLVAGRQRSRAVFVPRRAVPTWPHAPRDLLADRATQFDLDVYYAAAAPIITFGPGFRLLREAWRTSSGVLAGIFDVSPDTRPILPEGAARLITEPLLLDNVGRLALIDVFHRFGDHVVPVNVQRAVIRRPAPGSTRVLGSVDVRPEGPGQYAMRVHVAELDGTPLIEVDNILLQKLNNHAARRSLARTTA